MLSRVQIKEELKAQGKKIRAMKYEVKELQRSLEIGKAANLQWKLSCEQYAFRHKHIAYCLMRGRTIEQVEQRNKPDNKPHMDVVERYMKKWAQDEAA